MLMTILWLADMSQAGVSTLSPIADSYIRISDTASSTHGTEVYMVTNNGSSSGKTRWSFLKFDLRGIQEPIVGVKLELQADKTGGAFSALPHAVYGLITGENWTEIGLNYTNAPARSGNTVNMAGVYGGAALSTFSYTGFVSGNAGGTVAAVIDQANGGLAVDFIKADSDKVVTFIIARTGPASDSGVAWATREKTYTDVAAPRLTVYTGAAVNPNPANGQGLAVDSTSPLFTPVAISQVLSWQAVSDPNIDPAFVPLYRVYMDTDKTKVDTATGCQYTRDFAAGTSYDPTPDLAYETTYYWRVDSKIKWNYKTDPNTIPGTIWTFKTVATLPTILTNPTNAKFKAAQTATFTATYQSISTVTSVTWYKNNSILQADAHYSVTWDQTSSTLTISNADDSDTGSYYCSVSNHGGSSPSGTALLVEKKLLAWYEFEQNADDSIGTNDGMIVGPALQYAAGKVTQDSQAYAADPNGGNYIQLSADAYPKAGFGNGLEEGTISFWIKCNAADTGFILGNYNTATKTALHFEVRTDGRIGVNLRDEEANAFMPVSGKVINDNQWHYITLTMTPTGGTLYTDVVDKVTGTASLDNYAAWQNPMAILARNQRGTIEGKFPGLVDDLKIYNYQQTREDAALDYYNVTGIASCIAPQTVGSYDLNNDCKVDISDFLIFANAWLHNGLYPMQ